MHIAVIPARGGSKRIPRKNIKDFLGKPMIAWSIEKALLSKKFEKVIVSTDDEEIANIALKFGASVPFMRPDNISDDFSNTLDVMHHAASFFHNNGDSVSSICCIYPTSPLMEVDDLLRAYDIIQTGLWRFVLTVTDFSSSIYRALEFSDDGVYPIFPENFYKRSQDLPPAYHDAGQFYWGLTEGWLNKEPAIGKKVYPIVLPRWRVQDIDTESDWEVAEKIAKTGLVIRDVS